MSLHQYIYIYNYKELLFFQCKIFRIDLVTVETRKQTIWGPDQHTNICTYLFLFLSRLNQLWDVASSGHRKTLLVTCFLPKGINTTITVHSNGASSSWQWSARHANIFWKTTKVWMHLLNKNKDLNLGKMNFKTNFHEQLTNASYSHILQLSSV